MSEYQAPDFGDNPYRSPLAGNDAFVGDDESGQIVTNNVASFLRQTQPWVRFLSVLGFIVSALMVLVGSIGGIALLARGGDPSAQLFVVLVYIPMGILYTFPASYLFRYASHINALWTTRNVRQLEDALEAQKSFWKFAGILMLIVLVLYLLGIVLVFGFAATGSL